MTKVFLLKFPKISQKVIYKKIKRVYIWTPFVLWMTVVLSITCRSSHLRIKRKYTFGGVNGCLPVSDCPNTTLFPSTKYNFSYQYLVVTLQTEI